MDGKDEQLELQVYEVLTRCIEDDLASDDSVSDVELVEESYDDERPAMDTLLSASLALLLQTIPPAQVDLAVERGALDQLTVLAVEYMQRLYGNLAKLSEYQRRRRPSKGDLELLLREGYFDLGDLTEEYHRSRLVGHRAKKVKQLSKAVANLEKPQEGPTEVAPDDPEYAFFHEQPQIVDSLKKKPYMPSWTPPLPPAYTYRATPNYSKRVTDPRKMREKLVEEGRLGEKALDHIMEPAEQHKLAEKEQPEQLESAESDLADNSLRQSIDRDEKFDVVAYAEQRMKVLEKRRLEEDRRIKSRTQSDEARLGRHLGAYTRDLKYPEEYSDTLAQFYRDKIEAVKDRLEKQKELWDERKKVEELRKRQQEKEVGSIEVGGGEVEEDVDIEMAFEDAEMIEEELELEEDEEEHQEAGQVEEVDNCKHEGKVEEADNVAETRDADSAQPDLNVFPGLAQSDAPEHPKISLKLHIDTPEPVQPEPAGAQAPAIMDPEDMDLDDFDELF